MSLFCLPLPPKTGRAETKVDKNWGECLIFVYQLIQNWSARPWKYTKNGRNDSFLSTAASKNGVRGPESRQKPGKMCDFCLPMTQKSVCATPKVEQNLEKLRKCSTRLPSTKNFGLRLRANLRNQRFDRKRSQVQRLNRWCAALHLAKSLSFTDTSMKMGKNGHLSVKTQTFRPRFYGQMIRKEASVRKFRVKSWRTTQKIKNTCHHGTYFYHYLVAYGLIPARFHTLF